MIIHVDMDAFYAAIEINHRPDLINKPVVVGGSGKRGVVSTANYVARQFGIHSAMPIASAKKKCAELIIVPVRMKLYAAVSKKINDIFKQYTPLVEPLSLDEAFLDPRGSEKLFGSATSIAHKIKHTIQSDLNLTASIGIAPNKFLAKIASDIEKPNGFVIVDAKNIHGFLDPLPISRLWGIGQVTKNKLNNVGFFTIGQIRQCDEKDLQAIFGNSGQHFWRLANGIDDRAVVPYQMAKSISHERTFDIDVADKSILLSYLMDLTELVAWRLRNNNMFGRSIQLKIRFSNFQTITRSTTLPDSTNSTRIIWDVIQQLFEKLAIQKPVRLVGVGISALTQDKTLQMDLFSDRNIKNEELDRVTDTINNRFGPSALRRAMKYKNKGATKE